MAAIVTRESKGSALTAAEMDGNLLGLNTELGGKAPTAHTQGADTITETPELKVMTAAERDKLGGVAPNATANAADAALRDRNTHTGTQPQDSIDGLLDALGAMLSKVEAAATYAGQGHTHTAADVAETALRKWMTDAMVSKLAGIAPNATANQIDAFLLARGNHTGTQLSTTISDFVETCQDVLGALVVQAGGTYDDTTGAITFPAGGGGGGGIPEGQVDLAVVAGAIDTNAAAARNFAVPALTAATVLNNPTGLVAGMTLTWRFIQGGGGTLTFGSMFKFSFANNPAMSTVVGAKEILTAYFDGTDLLPTYSNEHR